MQDMEERIKQLRADAGEVLERLKGQPPERPYFVEFAGTPKSGKSSNIDIVEHFFRRVGFNVVAPSEGASKRTPRYLKADWPAFNTWTASYALMQVVEGLHDPAKPHISILDRGLFDALAWFELMKRQDYIEEGFAESVQNFLTIDKWRGAIDRVILFTADPGVSMERENAQTLIDDEGQAMNPDLLGDLNCAYEAIRVRFAGSFRRFCTIDTTEMKKARDSAFKVARLMVNDLLEIQENGQ